VLLGGGDQLDGRELEAAVLEALDDGADQAALWVDSMLEGCFVLHVMSCMFVLSLLGVYLMGGEGGGGGYVPGRRQA
jgi:hypothetical protein